MMKSLFEQALEELEDKPYRISAKTIADRMDKLSVTHPAQYLDYVELAMLVKFEPYAELVRKAVGISLPKLACRENS